MATSTETVDLVGDEAATNLARAALFAALVGAFAYVTFPNPVSPVSVTLQVLGVFLAGIYLVQWGGGINRPLPRGRRAGRPGVQGGSAGVGQLVGQSAGYLWSYPLAAAAVGAVVHRGVTPRDLDTVGLPTLVGAMVLGTVVIYALGGGRARLCALARANRGGDRRRRRVPPRGGAEDRRRGRHRSLRRGRGRVRRSVAEFEVTP